MNFYACTVSNKDNQIFFNRSEDLMECAATSQCENFLGMMDIIPTQITDNFKIHVIMFHDVHYILKREISHLLLQSDELQSHLDKKGINIPTLILNKNDDAELYLQLLK